MVEAEYVLLEVNGLFTYTYSLTADTALCNSQPQNWTSIAEMAGDQGPFAWDREVVLALQLFLKQVTTGHTQCVLGAVWVPSVCCNRTPETR